MTWHMNVNEPRAISLVARSAVRCSSDCKTTPSSEIRHGQLQSIFSIN